VKDLRTEILEYKVKERTANLEEAQLEILERLALAAEFRDDETGQHTQRVGRTAAVLARALELPVDQVTLIHRAAPLHDVGKLGIPDSILRKPGKLTAEEFEVMKTHTTIGAQILSGSRFPILQLAEEIALTHHERWDGTGYAGLAGERIPLSGRIVALADVFDALTNDRIYRKALPLEDALAEIELQRGRHFDPAIADAFLRTTRPLLSEESSILKQVS
jgi:putative two-component system response regulator